MGTFVVNVEVGKPMGRPVFAKVSRILVDTGSEMTWIAASTLQSLKIDVRKKDQAFIMANGQTITRDVGYAIIRCDEFETVDEVVFARQGDLQLLGARTLEGFNARVDSRHKRLVAAGPIPAANVFRLKPAARSGWHEFVTTTGSDTGPIANAPPES